MSKRSRLGDETVDADVEQLIIPIHAFDLIIADECHRGYSAKHMSVWRRTLDHFDAVKIGLTATPAAHTVAYFENLVFRYKYDRAVREGYLVDYDVVRVRSNVREGAGPAQVPADGVGVLLGGWCESDAYGASHAGSSRRPSRLACRTRLVW
jgi:type I site-specific restriction endonuclease